MVKNIVDPCDIFSAVMGARENFLRAHRNVGDQLGAEIQELKQANLKYAILRVGEDDVLQNFPDGLKNSRVCKIVPLNILNMDNRELKEYAETKYLEYGYEISNPNRGHFGSHAVKGSLVDAKRKLKITGGIRQRKLSKKVFSSHDRKKKIAEQ